MKAKKETNSRKQQRQVKRINKGLCEVSNNHAIISMIEVDYLFIELNEKPFLN